MSIENNDLDINISRRVKMARGYAGIDQNTAADHLSLSVVTLSRYENGKRPVGGKTAIKMSELYGVSIDWLLTGEGPMTVAVGQVTLPRPKVSGTIEVEPPNTSPHYEHRPAIMVPVISWVQAGDWQYAADPMQPGVADEWIETSATHSRHAYALVVHGDSMEPEFRDGDVITVDPERRAENGSYVIVKNGVEATFKQYVVDGQSVFLKPLNDRYPIKDMTGIEFRVVGVVVEKRKRY